MAMRHYDCCALKHFKDIFYRYPHICIDGTRIFIAIYLNGFSIHIYIPIKSFEQLVLVSCPVGNSGFQKPYKKEEETYIVLVD